MKKLRHRDTEQFAQGHTVTKWKKWELNPGNLASVLNLTNTISRYFYLWKKINNNIAS